MARLPFDPERVAGPQREQPLANVSSQFELLADGNSQLRSHSGGGIDTLPQAPQPAQYTVSQAAELIRLALERHTPVPLRVIGQVSNLNAREHWYFSLKDQQAVLNCVAWATTVRKFAFRPKDGDEIVATGHLSFYPQQGRAQLYVSEIAPVGAGALELRFRALCEELRGLGYFEESRKKPLPVFPRRIAVITSAGGAAMHDVVTTAAQRCKAVGLLIVNVRVQGDGSAKEIARAIRWVDSQHARLKVDAMLVTRGGGSIEDLWAFNERIVADAIFKCSLPIVAAIGHESDTTIAELVADVRASTPTQAAMRLVPSSVELCKHLEHLAHRVHALVARGVERRREGSHRSINDLRRIVTGRFAHERALLERLAARLNRLQPQRVLMEREAKLKMATERLHRAMIRRIDRRPALRTSEYALHGAAQRHVHRLRERLTAMQRQLAAVDPLGVLRRGYSITAGSDGRVVRSVTDVAVGNEIVTRIADGAFESVVGKVDAVRASIAKPRAPGAESAKPHPRNGRRTLPHAADQMDLFTRSD